MAAGSTETAFSATNQTLPCFNTNLLKTDPNKYWNGAQIMATASTDGFWEDDPEEKIKKKVLAAKSLFHAGRQLQIKHLPRDVTEDEIRDLLCDFPVQSVHIVNSGTGSSIARADLEDPEMLEDWDRDRVFLLRGQCVPVTPTLTEKMLCIARLPFGYTEEQFTAMVLAYGEIKRNFLMISEKTGESKGYGFVEYVKEESALQAKNFLDQKILDGWIVVCDWLDPSHVTFESLHSKCLYVDCLPKDFRDMSEFRKIFSSIVNPPYCQIALKNGCPQDWGLVEFSNWEDSEVAQTTLNNYCLKGRNIRISYYIPGVRAINLYLKLLNEASQKEKGAGLLPDPSNQTIILSLQNLFKQNPIFAQNLQNIILGQIHATHSGESTESLKKGNPNGPPLPPAPNGTALKNGSVPGGKIFRPNGMMEGRNLPPSVAPPTQPLPHPPPSGPSPTQFVKPVPPSKVPLLPSPGVVPPTSTRRLSISPPAGEVAPKPQSQGEEDTQTNNYWAGLIGQLGGVPPNARNSGGHNNFPPPTIHHDASGRTFNVPPPNYIAENMNVPVELQQSIINLLSNPQNLQQLLTSLHSLNQTSPPTPTPVPPPTFSFPMNPMQPAVDPAWAQPIPPPHHLPRSLLTSPITVPPKPVNYLEVKPPPPPGTPLFPQVTAWAPTFLPSPPPQAMFSPFGSPALIWSQTTPLIASPQPNPLMTPIGQKRRLLPSPEPSPEGNYIGQHSQGIGGHYADSYFKRKKKH
uniref:RRM domain-containing protein n=1 Tax=Clastoptera arizonana TaxID=38151 RepID=A0A1B6CT95_9HEMI